MQLLMQGYWNTSKSLLFTLCMPLQVQSVVNAMSGSHNRVEAAICLYARMVDKDNLSLVLYALKVNSRSACYTHLSGPKILQDCPR